MPFVLKVASTPLPTNKTLDGKYFSVDKQEELSKYLLDVMKFDWNRGVIKTSEHPFTSGFTSQEVRITTHYYTNNLFSSEYVIYTNYEYHIDDKDLTTYQLGSYILDTIGCETGILNALHQTKDSNDQYYDYLEMLEYDMLFGERYIWNKENPYSKTEIKFGYDDITINSYLYENNVLTIYGENFNMNSYIYINDKKQESMYINSNTLVIEDIDIDSGDIIVLSQLADNNMVLYTSNQIIVE